MPNTYRQGESWVQTLVPTQDGLTQTFGPAAQVASQVHSIEVLLLVAQRVQAMYRYPASGSLMEFEPISFDAVATGTLSINITRALSRHFETGYLYAAVLIRYTDAQFPAGRCVECMVPIGYMVRGETASL